MNQLHPGARWVFRLNAYSRFGGLFFILVYFLVFSSFDNSRYSLFRTFFGNSFLITLLSVLLCVIIFVLIVGEIYARMTYNRYLYEIIHDSVKIEHGIIWKKYTSIPYERVQNIDIRRGIIARMFNFSTIEIETAGQSGMGSYYGFRRRRYQRYKSEGHLPAIDIDGAEKIREFVMRKIKHIRSGAGLG